MSHYRSLIAAVAVVLVPTLLIGGLALGYWRDQSTLAGATSGRANLLGLLGVLVIALGNILVQAAGVYAATSAAVGGAVDWRASIRVALERRTAVLVSSVAVTLFAFLGLVVFLIPGIYLWFAWFVVIPVVVLENQPARAAMSRSHALVRGRWWQTFAAFLLIQLFVVALSIPVGFVVGAIFSSASTTAAVVQQLATYAVEILLAPVEIALVAVVYLDLRLHQEGVGADAVAREAGIALVGDLGGGPRWPPPAPPAGPEGPIAPRPFVPEPPPSRPVPAPPGGERATRGGAVPWPAVSPKPAPPVARVARPAAPAMPDEPEPPRKEQSGIAEDAPDEDETGEERPGRD